jgi:hypothetical protein
VQIDPFFVEKQSPWAQSVNFVGQVPYIRVTQDCPISLFFAGGLNSAQSLLESPPPPLQVESTNASNGVLNAKTINLPLFMASSLHELMN